MSDSFFPDMDELKVLATLIKDYIYPEESSVGVTDVMSDLLDMEDDRALRLATRLYRTTQHMDELITAMRLELAEYRRIYTTANRLEAYREQVDDMIRRGDTAPLPD